MRWGGDLGRRGRDGAMNAYPIKLTYHVRAYAFGERLIPEMLGKRDVPEGVVAETWEANIEAALDELREDYRPRPNPGLALEDGPNTRVLCCAGPYFALERWSLTEPYTEPSHPECCLTLSCVGDPARIEYAGGVEGLDRGESCVLPASIGEVRVVPGEA